MRKLAKITLPKANDGLNVNPINSGRALSSGAFFPSSNFTEPDVNINSTLKPTPRDEANLEAEKGETVVTNLAQTGIPEFYKIGGKRHYDGGTPLNLPQDSFIFSRDIKMRIKDPAILKQFGMTIKKGSRKGFTPAEISKKYDINVYRKILADPSSDKFQIETAEAMITNYNIKLGQLALIQESIKGFPSGIPGIAMPYVEFAGIDVEQLVKIPGQEEQAPQMQPQANYGGHNYFQGGGGPKNKDDRGVGNDDGIYTSVEGDTPLYSADMFIGKTDEEIIHQAHTMSTLAQKNPGTFETTPETRNQVVNSKFTTEGYYAAANELGDPGSNWHTIEDGWSNKREEEEKKKRGYDKSFTPALQYEQPSKGFKKGRMQRFIAGTNPTTGEFGKWAYSTDKEITDYYKNYGQGEFTTAEIIDQIKTQPELFASSWGQKAAKEAVIAELTLTPNKRLGGDIPKYQTTGEVRPDEDQYTQGIRDDQNLPAESDYTQGLGFEAPQTGETFDGWWQRVAGTLPFKPDKRVWNGQEWVAAGTVPQLASRATSTQKIPKDSVTWDMSEPGYDEKEVQPGDYVKQKDGKWYQVTGFSTKKSAYTGEKLDPKLDGPVSDFREDYGRLEQRIMESPELQDAIVAEYRKIMAKAKSSSGLSKEELKAARELEPDQIISNFFRAQKQIMGIQAHKGKIETNSEDWDRSNDPYISTVTGLGYEAMNPAQIAAFQGTYIGLNNVSKSSKYKELLEDFQVIKVGEDDEPGTLSGATNISEVDGRFGNTTYLQSAKYYPHAKELEFKEAEWRKAIDPKSVKHMANTAGYEQTPFWTEDIINGSFALRNLWNIQKQKPWNAIPGVKLPRPTFLTPDQQIQNILGASGQAVNAAAASGSPQALVANTAALQANAMQSVSNAIGTVHDKNVQIANQFQRHRAQILNKANNKRAQLATTLHDKNTVLNQQYTNSKNKAWDEIRQGMVNMWTNRGKTQTMNEMTDNFSVDPRTGYTYKTYDRPVTPKNANQQDLSVRATALMHSIPGLSADRAAQIAMKERGTPLSPTGMTGIDPPEMAAGYPRSIPSYYPQEG